MAHDSIETIRAEAKRRGVAWRMVVEACRELRAEAAAAREHLNQVRQAAWYCHTFNTPWAWPFWRIGFQTRFGKRVEAGDYTVVPSYDRLHQQVAGMFPEWGDDDGCERLWAFLLSPYDPLPKRAELWGQALERAESNVADRRDAAAMAFDFGANLVVS